jgi:hypothetical protein
MLKLYLQLAGLKTSNAEKVIRVKIFAEGGRKLRCYFVGDPQFSFYETEHFRNMLAFVEKHGRVMGISFKQTPRDFILVQDEVSSIAQAKKTLDKLVARE